jgi:hypothetical protein
MITISGTRYSLAQLDTNVLSEMLKHPRREFRHFFERFFVRQYVPCVSGFTLLEIMDAPPIYDIFLDYFSTLPIVILKGYEQLLEDEISAYPDPSCIVPALVATPIVDLPQGMTRREGLEAALQSPDVQERRDSWLGDVKSEIINGMLSLVRNFPPNGTSYSKKRIREFGAEASFQQLCMRAPAFVQSVLDSGGTVEVAAFPSVMAMSYTVFYKFYADASRRPSESDVFDIIMAGSVPYVDSVFTERHQAEVLKKLRGVDAVAEHVKTYTLADLR